MTTVMNIKNDENSENGLKELSDEIIEIKDGG